MSGMHTWQSTWTKQKSNELHSNIVPTSSNLVQEDKNNDNFTTRWQINSKECKIDQSIAIALDDILTTQTIFSKHIVGIPFS